MIFRLILITAILLAASTIPGCHYYINAMPHVVISSEPFVAEQSVNNAPPKIPAPEITTHDGQPTQ